MIILLHGTGDDDSKPENWMSWVAEAGRRNGERVLVLPGVASSQCDKQADRALTFLEELGGGLGRPVHEGPSRLPALNAAISSAASAESELARALLRGPSHVELVRAVKEAQRDERRRSAIGIKTRAAYAAICARAYVELTPDPKLIRIIGHSRGGAAGIATLNLLRYFGIDRVRVLALDPCHGIKKFGAKEYTYVVYSGTVVNIPAVKFVGGFIPTLRQRIQVGRDGTADIVNHAPLEAIAHGHMGKLVHFRGADAEKAADRVSLETEARALFAGNPRSFRDDLLAIFDLRNDASVDWRDKHVIVERVLWTLLEPEPMLEARRPGASAIPAGRARARNSMLTAYRAISRSEVGRADKDAIVEKLKALFRDHPGSAFVVVDALIDFKRLEQAEPLMPSSVDEALHSALDGLDDVVAAAGDGARDRYPTARELFILVRNSSSIAQRAIPSRFKAFLQSLPAGTLAAMVEARGGERARRKFRAFLTDNRVPVVPAPRGRPEALREWDFPRVRDELRKASREDHGFDRDRPQRHTCAMSVATLLDAARALEAFDDGPVRAELLESVTRVCGAAGSLPEGAQTELAVRLREQDERVDSLVAKAPKKSFSISSLRSSGGGANAGHMQGGAAVSRATGANLGAPTFADHVIVAILGGGAPAQSDRERYVAWLDRAALPSGTVVQLRQGSLFIRALEASRTVVVRSVFVVAYTGVPLAHLETTCEFEVTFDEPAPGGKIKAAVHLRELNRSFLVLPNDVHAR